MGEMAVPAPVAEGLRTGFEFDTTGFRLEQSIQNTRFWRYFFADDLNNRLVVDRHFEPGGWGEHRSLETVQTICNSVWDSVLIPGATPIVVHFPPVAASSVFQRATEPGFDGLALEQAIIAISEVVIQIGHPDVQEHVTKLEFPRAERPLDQDDGSFLAELCDGDTTLIESFQRTLKEARASFEDSEDNICLEFNADDIFADPEIPARVLCLPFVETIDLQFARCVSNLVELACFGGLTTSGKFVIENAAERTGRKPKLLASQVIYALIEHGYLNRVKHRGAIENLMELKTLTARLLE